MKRILTSFALVAASLAFSQVSVSGDDTHTPEATLDVKAIGGTTTADGVLIPRVDRLRAQNMPNVKHSTLIYVSSVDNGAQSGQANQIDATGFYYFDTTVNSGEWVKLGGGASAQNWEQIKYDQTNGKFVMTGSNQQMPKDTWLAVGDVGYDMLRLPEMQPEDAGRMIVVYKKGIGNLTVADHQGLVPGQPGSVIECENSVRANRGRTFIWMGDFWGTTNY